MFISRCLYTSKLDLINFSHLMMVYFYFFGFCWRIIIYIFRSIMLWGFLVVKEFASFQLLEISFNGVSWIESMFALSTKHEETSQDLSSSAKLGIKLALSAVWLCILILPGIGGQILIAIYCGLIACLCIFIASY